MHYANELHVGTNENSRRDLNQNFSRKLEIGQVNRSDASVYESKETRGISFCDTLSSSKSCHQSVGGASSVAEEDLGDGTSSEDGIGSHSSLLHEDDDDKSNDDQDDQDFEEKIRWLFINRDEEEKDQPKGFSEEEANEAG